PLVGAERRQALADLRVLEHAVAVRHVVEQAHRVEHEIARIDAGEEAARHQRRLDGAERHAFHRARDLAELVRGIELDLDAPERGSTPAFIAFIHSIFMSFTVGAESFMVYWACAGAESAHAAATSRAFMGVPPPGNILA